jgi:hypothetical protein
MGDDSPPAKAYAKYHRACIAGDVAQILASVTSNNRKEMDSYEKAEFQAVINFLRVRPSKIKIGKPVIADDEASFTVEGSESTGEKATGSIKMILEDGKWKVAEDKWKLIAN